MTGAKAPTGEDPPLHHDSSCRAMVELACAMAIQDAVAYLRNTEIVAVAVIGAAEEMILNGLNVPDATATLSAAQASVTAATGIVKEVGSIVNELLKNYPRDLGSTPPNPTARS